MSTVKVTVHRRRDHSEIKVDGKTCGAISDYGDEYSATVTDVVSKIIDKLNIDNTEVIEVKEK